MRPKSCSIHSRTIALSALLGTNLHLEVTDRICPCEGDAATCGNRALDGARTSAAQMPMC
jgi:hypothetical protein